MSDESLPKPDAKPKTVLTVDEAAEMLRVDRKTIYRAIEDGEIPGVIRLGRVIRVCRLTLERWMAE